MAKKKPANAGSKSAAKAAKKAKAAQKVEKKEKKKIKSNDDDGDDLEGILEQVCYLPIVSSLFCLLPSQFGP